jgi:hypothetical protein
MREGKAGARRTHGRFTRAAIECWREAREMPGLSANQSMRTHEVLDPQSRRANPLPRTETEKRDGFFVRGGGSNTD